MRTIPKLDKTIDGYRIALYGPIASGKTFLADYLVKNYQFYKISLADKLKSIAYELYGVQGKDGNNRALLQNLGDSLRKFDDDVFTKYTLNRIWQREFHEKHLRVVVDDVRLPREAQLLRANGFKLIRVEADEEVRLARVAKAYPNVPPERLQHATETTFHQIRRHAAVHSNEVADVIEIDALLASYWGTDNEERMY